MMRRKAEELEAAPDYNKLECTWVSESGDVHRFEIAEAGGLLWLPDGDAEEGWVHLPIRHAETIAEFILEVLK